MVFVKVIRNKSYFKRFQVRFRRRRFGSEGQGASKNLLALGKNKYQTPKHRLIVRFTNKDICAQIALSRIEGDVILTAAYSHELPRYGVSVGLTNYAAGYCTGLLLARRVLQKLDLECMFEGKTVADGEMFSVEDVENGPEALRASLDIGEIRTTTGAKVFAVVKGAIDGGISLPYSTSWFPGYDKDSGTFDPAVLREHIMGVHIARYMERLAREDERAFALQFSQYIKNGVTADKVEEMYRQCHAAIRIDPTPKFKPKVSKKSERKKQSAKKQAQGNRGDAACERRKDWMAAVRQGKAEGAMI
ncbi:60S ribosomal protein L5-like isoform X2 [Penaeus japonicus]|uniref:60S ribosomal protein L5-like isoform X2 n=1 Tax=Penaeus japonicus TaxID=27405 RepID=UPI001C715666|nr:60S ribosomal protein L5-like isoform X2 [Penaeus japonicus]